jgi:peptidoglycan/xylan/chitin deacetylase (PgdA/CDA1 family)
VIGGVRDRADRIGMAVLVGALLAGSAGYTWLDQQPVMGVAARTVTSADERGGSPTPTPAAAAASSQASTASVAAGLADNPAFGSARVAPSLENVDPKTLGVPVNAPIVMTFSQPMNRPSVEMSFALQPKSEGRFVWSDDLTLSFEPFKLAHATAYQVEVRGRSLRGVTVSGPRSWTFTTVSGPPDVLSPGTYSVNVPILTYHYIRVNPDRYDQMGFALSVTPADFAAQMDWLARSGYHPITTEELHAYLQGARGLPSKPVILTFDDGYADFYTTALPILRSHDFRAVAYVVSGFVGRPSYMTSEQLSEVDRSGIEIGSHTVSHANLATASAWAVQAQLTESKQYLERLLGHEVVSFCYPSGKFTSTVASQVAAAGYHSATTTRFGYAHTVSDRYIWTRLRVSGGESLDQFAAAVRSAS